MPRMVQLETLLYTVLVSSKEDSEMVHFQNISRMELQMLKSKPRLTKHLKKSNPQNMTDQKTGSLLSKKRHQKKLRLLKSIMMTL